MNIRPIPNRPELGATEDGRIWRLIAPKTGRNAKRVVPFEAAQTTMRNGYRTVSLNDEHLYVHRLMLEAFVGPCPAGYVAAHNDDDSFNNRLENLRWSTHGSNALDRTTNSEFRRKFRKPDLLSKGDVEWIRAYPKRLGMFAEMAKRLQISQSHITQVYYGKKWGHIPGAHSPAEISA